MLRDTFQVIIEGVVCLRKNTVRAQHSSGHISCSNTCWLCHKSDSVQKSRAIKSFETHIMTFSSNHQPAACMWTLESIHPYIRVGAEAAAVTLTINCQRIIYRLIMMKDYFLYYLWPSDWASIRMEMVENNWTKTTALGRKVLSQRDENRAASRPNAQPPGLLLETVGSRSESADRVKTCLWISPFWNSSTVQSWNGWSSLSPTCRIRHLSGQRPGWD